MAAVEAAAGGRSEGSPPLCQSPPAPPPSPGAAARGDGAPLQLLENIDEVPHKERPPILSAAWRAATTPLASMRMVHNLHHITLLHVLQEGWKTSEESAQKELIDTIEKCMEKIKSKKESSLFEARLRYLVEVAKDPWHHVVLKNIMEGVVPDPQQVILWLQKEGSIGALERLRQLCEAGGQCEKAALRLALAMLPVPPAAPLLSLSRRNRILEVLLILLFRAHRTTECITHIKAMETNDAITIIGRLAIRNKSNGRIYKHAQDTALLCTQVSMATSLVKPLENSQLNTLVTRLASLYASKIDEFAPVLRKLLNSADTAGHIYIVCRAIQSSYGDTMRSFVCELYIRALTTGVNELERLKLQDVPGGKSTTISHQLADWFVSLADYLSANVTVSAECVLTAFSIYPSKQYYQRVIESAMLMKKVSTPIDAEKGLSPELSSDELFSRALDGLEADLQLLKMQKYPSSSSNALLSLDLNQKQPQSLVSSAVLEGENLDLSLDLCHDLAVLLSGPRLKLLTWDLSWKELSEHCLSYMADTEEGTKTVAATELKYVHLDYSQYEIKEPEVQDIYYGIEKGYEHHLELCDDEWEENDVLEEKHYETFSDCSDLHESKSKSKKSKKKSSKKSEDSDYRIRVKAEKVMKSIKKEGGREKRKTKGNHKVITSSTESDGVSDETKEKYGFMRTYPSKLKFAGNDLAPPKTYQAPSTPYNKYNYPKTNFDNKPSVVKVKQELPERNPLLNQLLANPNPCFPLNNTNSATSPNYTQHTSTAIRYNYPKNVSLFSETKTIPNKITSSLMSFRKPNYNANTAKPTGNLQYNPFSHPLYHQNNIAMKSEMPSSSNYQNIAVVKSEDTTNLECQLKAPIKYEYSNSTASWQKRIIECQNFNMAKNEIKLEKNTPPPQNEEITHFNRERKTYSKLESNRNELTLLRNKLMALQDSDSDKFRRKPQLDPAPSENIQRQSVIASTSSRQDPSVSTFNKETTHSQKVIDYASPQTFSPLGTKTAAESDVKTHINSNSIIHTHGCSSLVKDVSIDVKTANLSEPVDTNKRINEIVNAKALHSNTIPKNILRIAKHSQLSSTETDRSEKLNLVKEHLKTICIKKIGRMNQPVTSVKLINTNKSRTILSKSDEKEQVKKSTSRSDKVNLPAESIKKKQAELCKKNQTITQTQTPIPIKTTSPQKTIKAAHIPIETSLIKQDNVYLDIVENNTKNLKSHSKSTHKKSSKPTNKTVSSKKSEKLKKLAKILKPSNAIVDSALDTVIECIDNVVKNYTITNQHEPLSNTDSVVKEKSQTDPLSNADDVAKEKSQTDLSITDNVAKKGSKTDTCSNTDSGAKEQKQSDLFNIDNVAKEQQNQTDPLSNIDIMKDESPIDPLSNTDSVAKEQNQTYPFYNTDLVVMEETPSYPLSNTDSVAKEQNQTDSFYNTDIVVMRETPIDPLSVVKEQNQTDPFFNIDNVAEELNEIDPLSDTDQVVKEQSQIDVTNEAIEQQEILHESLSDADIIGKSHKRTTVVNKVVEDTVNNASDEQVSNLVKKKPVLNIVKKFKATDINLCNISDNKLKADVPKVKHITRKVTVALTPVEEILKMMKCKMSNVTVKASVEILEALDCAKLVKKTGMRSKFACKERKFDSNSETVQLPRKVSKGTDNVHLQTDETDKILKNVDSESTSDSDTPLIKNSKEKCALKDPIQETDDVLIIEDNELTYLSKNQTAPKKPLLKNPTVIQDPKLWNDIREHKKKYAKSLKKSKEMIEYSSKSKGQVNAVREIQVIELSDDSDVELIMSNDPIAIDTNLIKPSINPKKTNIQVKLLPAPPVFVALQPTPKLKLNYKKKFPKVKNKFQHKKAVQSTHLYIVNECSSKMIRVKGVPNADKEKLQMTCSVKITKADLTLRRSKLQYKNKITSVKTVLCNGKKKIDLSSKSLIYPMHGQKKVKEVSKNNLETKYLVRNCSISLKKDHNIFFMKNKSVECNTKEDEFRERNDSDAKRPLRRPTRNCSISSQSDVKVRSDENVNLGKKRSLRSSLNGKNDFTRANSSDQSDCKEVNLEENDDNLSMSQSSQNSISNVDFCINQTTDSDQSDVKEVTPEKSNEYLGARRSLRSCSTSVRNDLDVNLVNNESDMFDINKVKLEKSEIETQNQDDKESDLRSRWSSRATRNTIDSNNSQDDGSAFKDSKNGREAKIYRDVKNVAPRYLSRLTRRRFKNKGKRFKSIVQNNLAPIVIDCDLEPDLSKETNISEKTDISLCDTESSSNSCINLVSQCPDLINKTEEISIMNYQQPDVIPTYSQNETFDDYEEDNSHLNYDVFIDQKGIHKTYNKNSTKNKRKVNFSLDNIVKRFKNNSPTIDLPELSQVDIVSQKDSIPENYTMSFSLKHLLTSGMDCDLLDSTNDTEIKSIAVLDKKFIDILSEADSVRCESMNRPDLFEDCPDSVKFEQFSDDSDKDDTSDQISQQGKGFCDWSGRENMKDSSRGRQEGPAAALSDAIINRPPLALRNFFNIKPNDCFAQISLLEPKKPHFNNESNENMMKTTKGFFYSDENVCNSERLANEIKSILGPNKYKDTNLKENYTNCANSLLDKKYILSKVPGLDNMDFMRPLHSMNIVNVVQLGQLPVTSAQQSSLSNTSTNSQSTSSGFLDIASNNTGDYRSSNENSQQSSSNENNIDADDSKIQASENKSDEVDNNDSPEKPTTNDNHLNDTNTQSVSNETADKPVSQEFQQSTSQKTFAENEQKEDTIESTSENQINVPTSTTSFISTSRGLVNLLSQKLIQSPGGNQHVQMATFPKGTTINALSLQQALAQILPSSLNQSSESVIHNTAHSTSSPQVVHIVQGKNSGQTGNTFGSILVDSSQQGVMNNSAGTQVLHIVQGKSGGNSNNSAILNQSQIAGTTFSGLSLVEASGQQSGNQVLHIVNTGMQAKNNSTAQVLKRVNLLTSITNQQGNNEQKMVQFVCKSADGKPLQLNTQHQRGMVLRLQPIENSTYNQSPKTSEAQTAVTNTTVKTQEPSQQELKSRSVYEENYAKFIQNSSNPIVPSSPEKSVSLPKFNQAFGKSVYQENNSISKSSDNLEQIQNHASSTGNEQQNSQELTTLNLGQLGHIGSPPLLIRKAPSSNIVHQNVQQVKPSIQPMNIQTIHGGVIYTRQIPVNIGSGQTINLITVPSSDMMDEVQLQSPQKQNQEKSTPSEQQEPQVIKLVSQDQSQSNSTNIETSCDDTNQSFSDQSQNSAHPLLTQMRIKVPVLSKGGGQMVTGARVVRPVLQIQRNIIPGTNPAVYQQLVLTTAPTIRQPVPTPVTTVRPTRPPVTTHQESNLSSSTLEQLREFDMVLEQVKERSTTTQPNSNSSSTFSDNSPQVDNNSDIESNQPINPTPPAQREVLYSIGPNQTVNVTYVNQKVISKTPSILTTTYTSSDASQNSPSSQITHGLSGSISHTKPGPNTPTKITSKSIKTKPTKPANPSTSNASKSAPVAAKTSLQKPLEDEQTTQRILYILAEYKEQVENSPDKDKPAPRRRSNPPTNPTTTSKRKKGSGGSTSKKGGSGQSMQEMSPLGGEDAGHTMGSEDSSCGLSQGECTDNSIQGTDNQSPQSSPQKSTKKILFQPDPETPPTPNPQQQRNVIIADGQTIAMARPGTGKATAVLMPANYLLPMSMVKGSQQITIVTNQGPKILSVPQGEGGAANTLFVQRLISPAGLKPMLARPGQVRHVRLPANTVQNQSWIGTSSQPKLLVEYNSNVTNPDLNLDSIKTEISDSPTIKDEVMSIGSDHMPTIKTEDTGETSGESSLCIKKEEGLTDQDVQSIPDHFLQAHIAKSSGNTLNLIQLSNKAALSQSLNDDSAEIAGIQDSAANMLVRKHLHFDAQFLSGSKLNMGTDRETKLSDAANHLDGNLSMSSSSTPQTFILAHTSQNDSDTIIKTENHNPWSNGNGPGSDPSSSFVSFEDSPQRLTSHREDHHDIQESDGGRELSDGGVSRILRHPYSPSSSPTGPRHLYHKMFITAPSKKTFSSEIEHSTSSIDDDKQFVQRHRKKHKTSAVSARKHNSPFTIHHRHNPQVISIRHADDKSAIGESMDVSASVSGGRPGLGHNSSGHSAASLRHKYAVMEHELRLQKSLSEECEDLGVDSPSASDLFPEAELLFAASPSSQFDQSQDGCVLAPTQAPSVHLAGHQMSGSSNAREPKLLDNQPMEAAEESEFARMHPNTTFHSGEIELVNDDTDDAAIFRTSTNKITSSGPHMMTKRVDIVRSVIEGIGNNSGNANFTAAKLPTHFSMGDLSLRQTINVSSVQSSDDFSEGADDSMNSAESKDILVNNKCLGGLLTNEIVKRDLNLSSAESSICISSGIIQRNVTQVIRHASSDQLSLSGTETSEKLCSTTVNDLSENGRNFLLESGSDIRPAADSSILKSIMLERDGRDGLTCSSPDQHSELFWESNSNSNQSEGRISQAPPNLMDFSSEDSNKCCKSPLSCEESNSTDSSSLGDHNTQSHNSHHHHPLRLNSVIKSSGANSTAAEGPILHSALLSGTSNLNQDISKKPLTLNSIHKSDSNTSSSPEEDGNHGTNSRLWVRSHKGNRRVLSPQSLTTEINLGAEIETSSSEGVNIITKPSGGSMMHSDSSTPEEGSSNNRRVSLRAPGGIKRSCHCCSGDEPAQMPPNTNTNPRRARRKPPPLN